MMSRWLLPAALGMALLAACGEGSPPPGGGGGAIPPASDAGRGGVSGSTSAGGAAGTGTTTGAGGAVSTGAGGSSATGTGGGAGSTGGTTAVRDAGNPRDAARESAAGGGGTVASDASVQVPTGFPDASTQHLAIGVHDPSMIHVGSKWYLFATGGSLSMRTANDLISARWTNAGNIFSGGIPAWINTELGQTITALWAPDISFFNGQYHVYYAGSTFGSNHSVIGLATNPTLDNTSADFRWTDQGLVIESNKNGAPADNWNAIDPSVTFDANAQPWLVWGSFWSGIKLRQLDATTGQLSTTNTTMYSLATAPSHGPEAASIISHNGFYYLFLSFDKCCQGVNSTYNTRMGRASAITGPYTDSAGLDMTAGNAELLLQTDGRYIGPGGGTAFQDGNLYYYAYHYYDGDANGSSFLLVRPILFTTDNWVTLGDPLWQ